MEWNDLGDGPVEFTRTSLDVRQVAVARVVTPENRLPPGLQVESITRHVQAGLEHQLRSWYLGMAQKPIEISVPGTWWEQAKETLSLALDRESRVLPSLRVAGRRWRLRNWPRYMSLRARVLSRLLGIARKHLPYQRRIVKIDWHTIEGAAMARGWRREPGRNQVIIVGDQTRTVSADATAHFRIEDRLPPPLGPEPQWEFSDLENRAWDRRRRHDEHFGRSPEVVLLTRRQMACLTVGGRGMPGVQALHGLSAVVVEWEDQSARDPLCGTITLL